MIFRTRPSKPDQECGITIKNTTQEEEWMSPPYICHTYYEWEKTGSFRILANYSYAIASYIEFGNTQFKSISMHWAGLQCDIYRF